MATCGRLNVELASTVSTVHGLPAQVPRAGDRETITTPPVVARETTPTLPVPFTATSHHALAEAPGVYTGKSSTFWPFWFRGATRTSVSRFANGRVTQ
jgi:hypothetical protein